MNCESVQFCDSMPNCVHSLSPHFSNGVPARSICWPMPFWFWLARATFSWSTSMSQGRSLAFHCDVFAFSYSFTSAGRLRS